MTTNPDNQQPDNKKPTRNESNVGEVSSSIPDNELENILLRLRAGNDPDTKQPHITWDEAQRRLLAWRDKPKADRFEVIDETGRAYVKGSIYGSPVKIQLSYQDDGKTLKVFVDPRSGENGEE